MNPIIAAIVAALTAGATGGLTELEKTGIADAYQGLKHVLAKKFGSRSQVIQAVDHLEARPTSLSRQQGLLEEIVEARAGQDQEVLAAAERLLVQVQSFQKFAIENHASVQGQVIGDQNTVTQQFGEPPKA